MSDQKLETSVIFIPNEAWKACNSVSPEDGSIEIELNRNSIQDGSIEIDGAIERLELTWVEALWEEIARDFA